MKTLPLADARILAPVLGFVERCGGRAESYLDRVRIPGELVERGGMIAKKQCHDILLEIARRERCEEVGFAAYLGFQLGDLGPIGAAMDSAKTVKEALEVFARMASGLYEGNEYSVRTDGEVTWLCYRDNDHSSPGVVYSHHVTMTAYRQMVCLLAGESWHPRLLRCRGHETTAHLRVEGFEECQIIRDPNESALAVPAGLLCRSIRQSDDQATSDDSDQTLPARANEQCTFVESLERLIASRFLYRALPTLDLVATIIDVSPRTIQRYLKDHGMSYRRLLDRVCFDAACQMLTTTQMTIREVSEELGYAGTNSFVRGFRRMTGMTPLEYRQRDFEK